MEHYFSRLQNAIRQYWKRPAVANYNGEVITYSQLAENILRFHLLFEKSGIVKGDKISINRYGETFNLTVDNADPSQLGGVSIYATRNSW